MENHNVWNEGEFFQEDLNVLQMGLQIDCGNNFEERLHWSQKIYNECDSHYRFNDELIRKTFGERARYKLRPTESIYNTVVRKYLDCEQYVDNQFEVSLDNPQAIHPSTFWNQYKVFTWEFGYEYLGVPISVEKNNRGLELFNLHRLKFYTWIAVCKKTGSILDYIVVRNPEKLYEYYLKGRLNAMKKRLDDKLLLEVKVSSPLFQELIVVRKGFPFIGISN